ncbi:MAG: hypothetical protein ACFE68_05645, partial [Candidatus Hodarchaeota archaeon]
MSVAVSSDGNYIAAGSRDYKVSFFDGSGFLWSYTTDYNVLSVDVSADG